MGAVQNVIILILMCEKKTDIIGQNIKKGKQSNSGILRKIRRKDKTVYKKH